MHKVSGERKMEREKQREQEVSYLFCPLHLSFLCNECLSFSLYSASLWSVTFIDTSLFHCVLKQLSHSLRPCVLLA